MKALLATTVSIAALLATTSVAAQTGSVTSTQDAAPTNAPGQEAPSSGADAEMQGDIIVTAQRQSQRLQDVPIAVSAFSAANLEKQQIVNPVALQQSLPNVTFTKTNYTSASFTIRGIGDLCTGATCDSATAIHVNDMPLLGTRLFESEFFDLERVEVLRGPQGTLFGRNATSGVVNFISAKPDLTKVGAAGEFEYGNYDSKRVRAMFNLPLGDTFGVRVAGTYLNRDGYTRNLYTGNSIDGRDLYSARGTLSWKPDADTRIDLIGYYFHEKDDRARIQKQLCHRDPTGILGCLPDRLAAETPNGNSSIFTILTSSEFLNVAGAGALSPFALGSVYQSRDIFSNAVNPADPRVVSEDYEPTYAVSEQQYTLKAFHDFGPLSATFTGGYMKSKVDSSSDYNLMTTDSLANNAGLLALDTLGRTGQVAAFLNNMRQYLIPNGTGSLCQSLPDNNGVGVYGGQSVCAPTSLDFDRSRVTTRQYSTELHVDSSFDGPFNFLLGGIYFDSKQRNNDYYVNSFYLDYISGLLGSASTGGTSFIASPYFRNGTQEFRLKSFGVFGETYFDFNDKLKLTLGLRYNHDDKYVRARTTLLNIPVAFGSTTAIPAFDSGNVDFDPVRSGNQAFAINSVRFSRLTGRAVLDYRITRDNLLYVSYSRGYKSGGINPPVATIFQVPSTFAPEKVDAFEIGSKNTFGNGALRLNLTGFYYKYDNLQISRVVARTLVNDNIAADIYGVEAEAVISPTPAFVVNANFSYLKTKVAGDKFLANTRDPSGGRSDAVIIKDISNASNCALVPNQAGNAAGANAFVTAVNAGLGLRAPVAVPATNATGAYSVCSVLESAASNPSSALRALFNTPTGALPFTMLGNGVETNIRNNQLPNAPTFKWSVGAQYTIDMGSSGWTVVPRADLNYTGNSYGLIFNQNIDRIPGYEVINMQVQVNAPDDRFYLRGFVQNLTNNNATTGMYVTDQSSSLFTNIFTIEPRRYGIAAGFKF